MGLEQEALGLLPAKRPYFLEFKPDGIFVVHTKADDKLRSCETEEVKEFPSIDQRWHQRMYILLRSFFDYHFSKVVPAIDGPYYCSI